MPEKEGKKKEEKKEERKEEKKEEGVAEAKGAQAEEAKAAAEAKGPSAEEATTEAKTTEQPKVELSKKLQDVMKTIESMTVLELSGFVKALEEKFGVSAAVPMVAPSAGAAAAGAGPEAEEKATFTVVLAKVGDKKIQVIKEIRALTNLGLKEAKDLVESTPATVKEDVSKEEAGEIKKKLEAVGAAVELK